jgi:phosphate uptake regulator
MLRDFLKLLRKDDLQVQAMRECHEMLDLCQRMIDASVVSLRQRDDASIDIDILALDRKLNAFERDVRRKVMTHLSLGNPGDLATGLVLISIVIDVERIGDYAKNIHDLAVQHPSRLDGGAAEERIAKIEREALKLFRTAARAFKSGDENDARTLMREYKDEISRDVRRLEEALVGGTIDGISPADSASLALYGRFLKRIAAHARNLASSVVNPFDRIGYSE